MQNTDFLLNKLKEVPSIFGIESVASWLQNIENINQFKIIESLFDKNLSINQWRGLITLLNQKYANYIEPSYDFGDSFEKCLAPNSNNHKNIYLLDDKSKIIDFSKLLNLSKLKVNMAHRCEELSFFNPQLEMLNIGFLPKLTTIKSIESAVNLKYLTLTKCNKLNDFAFIRNLKKLIYLDLSDNKLIKQIDFISDDSEVRVLYLLFSRNIIKNEETFSRLSAMKHLKYLYITANKAEQRELRNWLPNCFINGELPLANQK
ncbi:hypothetical protein [Flavobacterium sp.]|uniref:hypothetical protein n=1 Tax=Flavobacterium sp. TaxID=239 RepID=UPI0031D7B36C